MSLVSSTYVIVASRIGFKNQSIISKSCLRKVGKLKDGSKVTIKIPINS